MSKKIMAEMPTVDDAEFAVSELKRRIPNTMKILIYEKKRASALHNDPVGQIDNMILGASAMDPFQWSPLAMPMITPAWDSSPMETDYRENAYVSVVTEDDQASFAGSILRAHGGVDITIQ